MAIPPRWVFLVSSEDQSLKHFFMHCVNDKAEIIRRPVLSLFVLVFVSSVSLGGI